MGDDDAAFGAVEEGLLTGSITELTAVLTAIWASDFGAVTVLINPL